MIKTEVEEEESNSLDVESEVSTQPLVSSGGYLIIISIVLVCLIVALSISLSNHSSIAPLPAATNKYTSVAALPLGSSNVSPVKTSQSNQTNDKQSASDAGSLGSSYTGLQDVPAGQGLPVTSSLQSSGQAQNTGQSINQSLLY